MGNAKPNGHNGSDGRLPADKLMEAFLYAAEIHGKQPSEDNLIDLFLGMGIAGKDNVEETLADAQAALMKKGAFPYAKGDRLNLLRLSRHARWDAKIIYDHHKASLDSYVRGI